MDAKKTKEHYFALLGLDPDAPWDQERFESILLQKQTEWSHNSNGVGRKALEAKRNLDAVPQIRSIMSDPAKRNAYRKTVQEELQAEYDAKYHAFVQQLKTKEAKGYLEEIEVNDLFKEFGDILSMEEISQHITVELRQFIDSSKLATTQEFLDFLKKSDLYELLGAFRNVSREELHHAAVQFYDDTVKRRDTTAEHQAKLKLAGLAQYFFSSDAKRKFYDSHLQEVQPQNLQKLGSAESQVPKGNMAHAPVAEVTHLTFQQIGTVLRLKWMWPNNCQEVMVYYGLRDYPRPRSSEALINSHRVTREVYDHFGYYDLRGPIDQPLYILVTAVFTQTGQRIMAAGVRLPAHLARRIIIDYEIRNPGRWHKACTLHLRTQSAVPVQLPAFCIRSKQNGLPLKKDDGDLFFQWSEDIQISKEYSIPLPDTSSLPRNTFGRLFLEDSLRTHVEFRLPSADKSRLRP